MSPNSNPYAKASDAYGTIGEETDQRLLEGKILLKAAQKIEQLQLRMKQGEDVPTVDVGDVLEYNQKLWILFVNDTMDPNHPLPQEIKNNIASLAVFIFNRTKDVLIEPTPDKLNILMSINRNIASGLMKKVPGAPAQQAAPPDKSTDSLA